MANTFSPTFQQPSFTPFNFYDYVNRSVYNDDDAIRQEQIVTQKLDSLDLFFKSPSKDIGSNRVSFSGNPPEHNFKDYNTLAYDIRQEQLPQQYWLNPNYAERCIKQRASGTGFISKQGVSYNTNRSIVDQESDLHNLNRILSNDPNKQYLPCLGQNCNIQLWGDSQNNFNFGPSAIHHDYTRLSNPQCTIKETGVNRFQPIQLNPQDETRWMPQNNINISTRMVAKDTFIPQITGSFNPYNMLPNPCFS